MNRTLIKIFAVAMLASVLWLGALGCGTTAQSVSYKSLATIATTVEAARQGFIAYANNCECITSNQFNEAKVVYGQYQLAMDAAQKAEIAANANPNDPAYQQAIAAAYASATSWAALVKSILEHK